jgi:hypothetical protein
MHSRVDAERSNAGVAAPESIPIARNCVELIDSTGQSVKFISNSEAFALKADNKADWVTMGKIIRLEAFQAKPIFPWKTKQSGYAGPLVMQMDT